MSALQRTLVKRRHAYTGEDVPWEIEDENVAALFKYLRGGGLKGLGCSSAHVSLLRRQARFLRLALVLVLGWILLGFL